LENESLKKEVDCLSEDLAKWFGSHTKFNHCSTSQKFTLNRNGIDYEPKKEKSAFIPKKTIFEKSQVKYNEEDKMKTCFIRPYPYPLMHPMFLERMLMGMFELNLLVYLLVTLKGNQFGCPKLW
jgi:hypothetical protein